MRGESPSQREGYEDDEQHAGVDGKRRVGPSAPYGETSRGRMAGNRTQNLHPRDKQLGDAAHCEPGRQDEQEESLRRSPKTVDQYAEDE